MDGPNDQYGRAAAYEGVQNITYIFGSLLSRDAIHAGGRLAHDTRQTQVLQRYQLPASQRLGLVIKAPAAYPGHSSGLFAHTKGLVAAVCMYSFILCKTGRWWNGCSTLSVMTHAHVAQTCRRAHAD